MGRHVIPLGRILGISDRAGLFLVPDLRAADLDAGRGLLSQRIQGLAHPWYWILGAITAIMLFVSVLLHELGHSVVAMGYRIPVRSITLFIFGGVAQIGGEPPSATAEFWIAIAGPVVSFLLAVLFALLRPADGQRCSPAGA